MMVLKVSWYGIHEATTLAAASALLPMALSGGEAGAVFPSYMGAGTVTSNAQDAVMRLCSDPQLSGPSFGATGAFFGNPEEAAHGALSLLLVACDWVRLDSNLLLTTRLLMQVHSGRRGRGWSRSRRRRPRRARAWWRAAGRCAARWHKRGRRRRRRPVLWPERQPL